MLRIFRAFVDRNNFDFLSFTTYVLGFWFKFSRVDLLACYYCGVVYSIGGDIGFAVSFEHAASVAMQLLWIILLFTR